MVAQCHVCTCKGMMAGHCDYCMMWVVTGCENRRCLEQVADKKRCMLCKLRGVRGDARYTIMCKVLSCSLRNQDFRDGDVYANGSAHLSDILLAVCEDFMALMKRWELSILVKLDSRSHAIKRMFGPAKSTEHYPRGHPLWQEMAEVIRLWTQRRNSLRMASTFGHIDQTFQKTSGTAEKSYEKKKKSKARTRAHGQGGSMAHGA